MRTIISILSSILFIGLFGLVMYFGIYVLAIAFGVFLVMALVRSVISFFSRGMKRVVSSDDCGDDQLTPPTSYKQKVFGDEEGEYVDFEEVD